MALTQSCPPRRAAPTRECGTGKVGVVRDVDGVKVVKLEPLCREEEVGSAVCARDPGSRQGSWECQESSG
jgi:hypothetical protein